MTNKIEWKQEKVSRENVNYNRIYFKYKGTEIYFLMPEDYDLNSTRIDLLHLAEILLLSPFKETDLIEKYRNTFTRNFGNNNSLSFSTGVDSTAAMLLLPSDTILAYHRRDFESLLIHDNADRFINYLKDKGKDVIVVPSNHEIIRTFHELPNGFSTDFACLAHLVLLADYLDLKSISTGMILEATYLRKGNSYRDLNNSEYFLKYNELFTKCGLHLYYPTAGLSEVLTTQLVEGSEYADYAQSCLRKLGGCNNCYKCYRKQMLRGNPISMNRETQKFISYRPPKVLTSMVYACQKARVILPELFNYMSMDLTFLERYYPKYLDLNDTGDSEIKEYLENKLKEFGIKPMTNSDITKLKKFDVRE